MLWFQPEGSSKVLAKWAPKLLAADHILRLATLLKIDLLKAWLMAASMRGGEVDRR